MCPSTLFVEIKVMVLLIDCIASTLLLLGNVSRDTERYLLISFFKHRVFPSISFNVSSSPSASPLIKDSKTFCALGIGQRRVFCCWFSMFCLNSLAIISDASVEGVAEIQISKVDLLIVNSFSANGVQKENDFLVFASSIRPSLYT